MQKASQRRAGAVLLVSFGVLLVLLVLGMRYPVVGREDRFPGMPNTLVLLAGLCSLVYSGLMLSLTRFEFKDRTGMIMPALSCFVVGTIAWAGCLLFFNGALDRSVPQAKMAYVTGKQVHQFRGTDYLLQVQDWRNPGSSIRLRVAPEIYQQVNVSAPVRVTTSGGLLGFERILSVQPA